MRRFRTLLLGVGFVLAFAAAMLYVTDQAVRGEDALHRIMRTGVLRVGYAVEAPYAYIRPDLEVTGESIETARLVARQLGVRSIEWVQVSFLNLIPELLSGRFDVIAAGMFVTPQRRQRVAFSLPSLRVASGLLVRTESLRAGQDVSDWLQHAGGRIATIEGAVEQERLLALGVPASRLVSGTSASNGLDELRQGRADALALSWPTVYAMQQKMGSAFKAYRLQVPGHPAYDEVAFAFDPTQQALVQVWNQALRGVRGSEAHLRAIRPFGLSASDVPARATGGGA